MQNKNILQLSETCTFQYYKGEGFSQAAAHNYGFKVSVVLYQQEDRRLS